MADVLASGGAPFAGCADVSGGYALNLVDSYGDGWNGNIWLLVMHLIQ